MSLPGRFLSLGGRRVFYSRSGPRTSGHSPVIFLHGYLVSHWAWRRVLPLIAETHDVIAFDFPGFGESDRPAPTEYGYDAAAFSETVIAVLDALEIDRASLVGHSMGGGIALYTTARQPERVDRLLVVDPLCFPFNIPIEGKLLLLPYVGPSIMRTVYSRPVIRHYMTRQVYRDPALASDEWVDYVWERVNRPGGMAAAHAALRMCHDPEVIARVARSVRAPTLIVWGEGDRLFPVADARRLQAEIPGAELCIVAACGHAPPEEKPDEVARALRSFLAAADRPRRPSVVAVRP